MAPDRIIVDTSVIIDFLRKKKKEVSTLWKIKETSNCFMSAITLFELLSGAKTERHFADIKIIANWIGQISLDDKTAELSACIYRNLKGKNQLLEFRDIFIAATAIHQSLTLATLNKKHFEQIEGLKLLYLP